MLGQAIDKAINHEFNFFEEHVSQTVDLCW